VRKYSGEMWKGDRPGHPEIACFDCVYNWLTDTTRDFGVDDMFICKLTLDLKAHNEQPQDELEREMLAGEAAYFEDEQARERASGRIAIPLIMCNGNFRKKVIVFKGKGNNGKSGYMSRVKYTFLTVSADGGEGAHWVTEANAEVRFFCYFFFC
jgi:hypothetical protein